MNKVFALLCLVSCVCATQLVLDKNTGKDDKVAKYHYYTYPTGAGSNDKVVRVAYLYPKLGANLTGLKTTGKLTPKLLTFLKFDDGEKLNYLLGFSDCKKWYGVYAEFYNPLVGTLHKVYAYDDKLYYLDLAGLGDFLHDKLTSDYYKGLLAGGLPSHPLVHYLGKYYSR